MAETEVDSAAQNHLLIEIPCR